jgi:hypothetical protein
VDAQKITEEYNFAAYDFGASNQNLPITYYYLQEALKTQTPKVVMVDIGRIFEDGYADTDEEKSLAWSYSATKLSVEKMNSLDYVLKGDKWKVLSYLFPLLQFHDRWKSFGLNDIMYYFTTHDFSSRGYLSRDNVESQDIMYLSDDDGDERLISEESSYAIMDIVALCNENNISLIFFKTPTSNWSRTDSCTVKAFMDDNNLEFIDMNEYLNEIGIDAEEDFYNRTHLNCYGAEKSTDFLGMYLKEIGA